ncbi:MAG TPA: DUF2202 domain-containing protein [Bacillota bacterium]|jgi:hypothetical protein|nr:DUF2202 domain-containing protein [Bacillota bacterium]
MNKTSAKTARTGALLAMAVVSALVVGLALGAGGMFTAWAAEASETQAEEKAGLVYMVEEEKLARDVYAKMFELWGLRIFRNIAGAEQRHIEHVREVLKAQSLSDPTASAKPGEFADARLQNLYDILVKKGSESQEAALTVGAAIEDLDICDLEALKAKTKSDEIASLYNALIAGSENHMRSFTGQLKARGVEYKPEHISPERYSSILAGSNGRNACGPDCDFAGNMGRTGRMGRTSDMGNGFSPGRAGGRGQRHGQRQGQRQGQRNRQARAVGGNCPYAGN